MATRRRAGAATSRVSPRRLNASGEMPSDRADELTMQMQSLGAAVAMLVDRERERTPERSEPPVESTRALELMAQAMSHLSTRLPHGRDAGSGSEGDDGQDGARGADVPEIRVADPRFQCLLSVRSYLLTRRNPKVFPRQVARLSKRAVELRPRLGTPFEGKSPLAVLPFLQRVCEIAEEAGLSEGVVLRLFPDLLAEPALTSFRSAKPNTYPEAVKWFLLTYAPETRVAESWRELQQIRQEDPETATEFALRLQTAAHQLGGLVSSTELKALYEGRLQDGTRHLFRATLPPDPNRTLSDSVAAAESLSQAVSATRGDRVSLSAPNARGHGNRGVFAIPDLWEEAESAISEEPTILEPEVDLGTVVCYGAPGPIAQGRPRVKNRVCWTCWLPGHFSEECPLIPGPVRVEIAERKRRALAESGYLPRVGPPKSSPQDRRWDRAAPPQKQLEGPTKAVEPADPSAGDEQRRGANALAPRL
jgi:hypothetical protein